MTNVTTYSPVAQHLLAAKGPFASVYYADTHDEPDAAFRMELLWQDIARELERQGAHPALIGPLEQAFQARPAAEHGGRGLICGDGEVLVDECLTNAPVTPVVRVSTLPYIVPIIDFGPISGALMVLAIDQVGADFTRYRGESTVCETIEAGGYPVHKAAAAGLNAWGDSQHRVEEEVRKNVRAVADHLTHELDREAVDFVLVIGQDRVRAELLSALPERVAARVAQPGTGSRHTGIDDAVHRAIAGEFQARRRQIAQQVADQYLAATGQRSGRAVTGLDAVSAALRENAVTALIIGQMSDETVLAGDDLTAIALDADTLSSFGIAPARTLRADEALPFAAMALGADLVPAAAGLQLADGVGALLRYVPPSY